MTMLVCLVVLVACKYGSLCVDDMCIEILVHAILKKIIYCFSMHNVYIKQIWDATK